MPERNNPWLALIWGMLICVVMMLFAISVDTGRIAAALGTIAKQGAYGQR